MGNVSDSETATRFEWQVARRPIWWGIGLGTSGMALFFTWAHSMRSFYFGVFS